MMREPHDVQTGFCQKGSGELRRFKQDSGRHEAPPWANLGVALAHVSLYCYWQRSKGTTRLF